MNERKEKLYHIDGEPYYPAGHFERDIEMLMKFVSNANVFSALALAFSAVAISLAILL